jgi:tetratricopeptide (TPR) repeat protein
MQNHSANQNQTLKEKNRQADMEKQMRTGGNSCPPPRLLASTGYLNPIKKVPNHKKRFVKNPLFPPLFGQNKSLKLSPNNVVINTHLLGLCLKEKGMWEEARQAFERALQVEGISRENQLAVKCELGVVLKKQGKTEEAFKIVREISASDQRFRNTNDKEVKLEKKRATKK